MSQEKTIDAKKGEARDDRLHYIRKTQQEVIRNNLKAEAKEKCKPYFKAFADCASKEGVFVVFKCRDKNEELSNCLDSHYTEDIFQKYLSDHGLKVDLNARA
mmetsp:Transcript_17781/g.29723  ORF Transcript_17781/g.29723 Transcript_17781/m.29723 type:complete len:102 (-) Transcript_17781:292-597(-)